LSYTRIPSQPFLGERTARGCFQVLFKRDRLSIIGKRNISLKLPRQPFRRMTDFASVVRFQAVLEIVCETDIKTVGRTLALQYVYVPHRRILARLRCSATSAWQPSISAGLPSRSGGAAKAGRLLLYH